MKLDDVTFETMQPLVGTTFWVEFPNGAKVELRATQVLKVMESEAARLARTPFSIYFLGPLSYMLKQGTYSVSHDSFGEAVSMFLVPVGQQADGYLYEAVFT